MKRLVIKMAKISNEHVKEICKVGSGSSTCSYLMMGTGWECTKDTAFEYTINERRKQRTINAEGDNCSGSPDFKVN